MQFRTFELFGSLVYTSAPSSLNRVSCPVFAHRQPVSLPHISLLMSGAGAKTQPSPRTCGIVGSPEAETRTHACYSRLKAL